MTRIAIPGAAGRMGRNLVEACVRTEGLAVGAATERSGHELLGSDAGVVAGVGELGVEIRADLEAVVDEFDVLIDFTAPAATERPDPTLVAGAGQRPRVGVQLFPVEVQAWPI